MKRLFTAALSIIVTVTLLLQFAACEKYILPEMSITPDTLRFSAVADSQVVSVRANVIWTFHNDDGYEWVSTTTPWGDTDAQIYVSVTENDSEMERTAVVKIKSESIERPLTIIQEGYFRPEPEEDF